MITRVTRAFQDLIEIVTKWIFRLFFHLEKELLSLFLPKILLRFSLHTFQYFNDTCYIFENFATNFPRTYSQNSKYRWRKEFVRKEIFEISSFTTL